MPAKKLTINSDNSCDEAVSYIIERYKAKRFLRLVIKEGEPRTLDQNSMFQHLYELIADWTGDRDVDDVRNECRLNFGIPILRRDDEDFNITCEKALDILPYDRQIALARVMDVTSLMLTPQGSEYITKILDVYGEQGVMWPAYLTKGRKR